MKCISIADQFNNFRSDVEKNPNKISNQLIFKPVFLKIKLGNFSEILTQEN